MNKSRFFLTALAALLIVTSFSFAGEDHDGEHHKVKIKIAGDGDVETMNIDGLEVGEARQFFAGDKQVTLTRDESGYTVNVDGEDIEIHSSGNHHGASVIALDGEEGHHVKVITKTISFSGDGEEGDNVFVFSGDGEEGENVFFFSDDEEGEHGEHSFVWVSDDEDSSTHDFVIQKKDVLSHVLDSEVLDGLDEDTRQRIIDAIKAGEKASSPQMFHGAQKFVIKGKKANDEENH